MTTPSKPSELPLVLALDIGTSSVRSLLFDSETRVVDGVEARRAHAFRVGPDGAVEADAAEILRLLCECIDETLARARNAAARVTALLALREIGLLRSLHDAPDCFGARNEPDMARHARYMTAMQRRQALYSVVHDGIV